MILFRWLHTIYAAILFVLTFLVVFPFLVLFAQKKSWHFYAYKLTHLWAIVYFPLIGARVRIENKNNGALQRPCIYVANHFSFNDIAAFPLIANDACFVGKQSISKAPLFGYFFTSLHITVNRESLRDRASVITKSVEVLAQGKSLFIFPEGGIRSTNPPYQVKYKDGAFSTAIRMGVPIVPVTFPFNWRMFPDDGKFLLRGNNLNIIVHEAIETKNLTDRDVAMLRDMTHDVIQTELLAKNRDYLS